MKKVLIAVDDSKGAKAAVKTFVNLFSCIRPKTVLLLYVEKIEGKSLMDEMLGVAEMSTLKEQLRGTVYQEAMDKKAKAVLNHYKKFLKGKRVTSVKSIIKVGHPTDEIIKTARKEGAEMIIIGSRGKRLHTFLLGSVSREVANIADIPVLIAR